MAEGVTELSGVPLTRALIPFLKAPPSCPHHCPETPAPNTITSELGLQHTRGGGGQKNSVYGKNLNLESDNQMCVSERSFLLCCEKDTNRGARSEVGKQLGNS